MATYDNQPEDRRINLTYGSRLRAIRCLMANAKSANLQGLEVFTKDDLELIQEICDNAEARAKEVHTTEAAAYNAKQPPSRVGSATK